MALPRILDGAADELVVVIVALQPDAPTIVAIADTRREPGYWRDRVLPEK